MSYGMPAELLGSEAGPAVTYFWLMIFYFITESCGPEIATSIG
jgi:hypothetical protein